jgi:hypothetical protein
MKLIFENWRKHLNEDRDQYGRDRHAVWQDRAKGFISDTIDKVFFQTDYEKEFKRANFQIDDERNVLTYNSPDGKFIELPYSEDSYLAAINRWDDYLRAKDQERIAAKYGSEEEIAALHGTKYNPN